ncbi:AzlC family ABC transporter permease [Klebsiella pneumoniae]|uniref:AzlC family ABC transporter permease n=1 Tax=Klebsiella pneumoniae TaxID=573 RepID=UPI00349E6803
MENPAPLTCALPERVATVGEGIKDSLPIVISYLPVAFAFGLNATRLGFTPLESLFFSCIIYAGASQFVITAMLAAGSSLWVAALTVMRWMSAMCCMAPHCAAAFAQRWIKRKPPSGPSA